MAERPARRSDETVRLQSGNGRDRALVSDQGGPQGIRGGRYGVRGQYGSYDVYYGVLSHERAQDEKAAVFVRLPAPPKAIYAGASTTE